MLSLGLRFASQLVPGAKHTPTGDFSTTCFVPLLDYSKALIIFGYKAILTIMTSFMSFIKLYICSGGSEETALQIAAGVSVGSEL